MNCQFSFDSCQIFNNASTGSSYSICPMHFQSHPSRFGQIYQCRFIADLSMKCSKKILSYCICAFWHDEKGLYCINSMLLAQSLDVQKGFCGYSSHPWSWVSVGKYQRRNNMTKDTLRVNVWEIRIRKTFLLTKPIEAYQYCQEFYNLENLKAQCSMVIAW